jgi:hypothetical protein
MALFHFFFGREGRRDQKSFLKHVFRLEMWLK